MAHVGAILTHVVAILTHVVAILTVAQYFGKFTIFEQGWEIHLDLFNGICRSPSLGTPPIATCKELLDLVKRDRR